MKVVGLRRVIVVLLLVVAIIPEFTHGRAQDDGDEGVSAVDPSDVEFGVGLYLTDCDALVEGTALFDLGDAELATGDFGDADENSGNDRVGTTLEEELNIEQEGDETDVEEAIGIGSDEPVDADRPIHVAGDVPLVWVANDQDVVFRADLASLITAPIAVAVRMNTQGEALEGDEDPGNDFIACGEFGGAISGNQIILPLGPVNGSGISGIAALSQKDDERATANVFLVRENVVSPSIPIRRTPAARVRAPVTLVTPTPRRASPAPAYSDNLVLHLELDDLDAELPDMADLTERLIQRALKRLLVGRTSFVIAHRLSTIREADKVVVMSLGEIVEIGTHDELIAKRGMYYNLYTMQWRDAGIAAD